MNSKIYRCGWCGTPTDTNGIVLNPEDFKRVVELINNYNTTPHEHLVNGECCLNGN